MDASQPTSPRRLPGFALTEYSALVGDLLSNGYVSRAVEETRELEQHRRLQDALHGLMPDQA